MPTIIKPEETRVEDQGDGWKVRRIAGSDLFGGAVMAAFHWYLDPDATSPEFEHDDYDEMIYVIAGDGVAVIGERRLRLEAESLLWLEPGDRCYFEAGAKGLEVLQGYAPGE